MADNFFSGSLEMNLVPFREYVFQAEEHVLKNPLSSRKIAFLSTEDPEVIMEAKTISSLLELSTDRGWEWYWSEIPRTQFPSRIQAYFVYLPIAQVSMAGRRLSSSFSGTGRK